MSESPDRVYRGNHWYNAAKYVWRPARGRGFPGRAVINIGFRLTVGTEGEQVNRGGGWDDSALNARVADRFRLVPANRGIYLGFRLARDGEDT